MVSLFFLTCVTLHITLEHDYFDPPQGAQASVRKGRPARRGRGTCTKLRDILVRLDAATVIDDMDLPGFRLHPLKGNLKGSWAVTVRANWRVIFRFVVHNVTDVDYVDYH